MKQLFTALLLIAGVALTGCGSSSTGTGNINGTWKAMLTSSSNETFAFSTVLAVNSNGSLGSSNFNFTVNDPSCPFPAETESGSFALTGNFNGQVTGTFHYVVTSTGTDINTLTLDGTVSGGHITGTWTVTGATAGCTGNGDFTMTPGT